MGLLNGKTLIVVSGAAKRAPAYRAVIESLGGRMIFLTPEDIRRAEAVAGADYVVIVTRVMSHKAMERILSILRGDRRNIIFVNSTGITTFQRILTQAANVRSTDAG